MWVLCFCVVVFIKHDPAYKCRISDWSSDRCSSDLGMPLEHLLLETDAPDQSDSAIRGPRNEPARLRTVCETIAELRGVPVEEISSATTGNAERLFGLMPAERAANIP